MNAVIYARYSSDNQREESIEGQLRECTEFAKKNNIMVVDHYIDRAFSAKTDARPEFQNMIKDSSKKVFDTVIVWKLDRFSRNRYDSARYKSILKKNGVKVISATENISSGSEGIILEAVLEGFAEYYSADLSEKVSRGMTENVIKGKFNGGLVPTGYYIDENREFQIDEITAPFILEAFKKFSRGETRKDIRDWLNENNVITPQGRPITYSSLGKIFRNRRYIGEFRFKDVVNENGIPPIVPRPLFDKVQRMIDINNKTPGRFNAKEEYLLTTKIFCGECGTRMCGESGRSKTGKRYYYYKCINAKQKKECKKKAIKKEWIEDFVVKHTLKCVMDEKTIEAVISYLMFVQNRKNINIPIYEQQLKEIVESLNNVMEAIEQGIFTKTTKTRIVELEEKKEELIEKIAKEKLKKPILTEPQIREWLLQFIEEGVKIEEQKKILISGFVNSVYVFEDKILIVFNTKNNDKEVTFTDIKGSELKTFTSPHKTAQ